MSIIHVSNFVFFLFITRAKIGWEQVSMFQSQFQKKKLKKTMKNKTEKQITTGKLQSFYEKYDIVISHRLFSVIFNVKLVHSKVQQTPMNIILNDELSNICNFYTYRLYVVHSFKI